MLARIGRKFSVKIGLPNMPVDLVLVRHGKAEGNEAFAAAKKGNNTFFTEQFMDTHESLWRLTPEGQKQAQETGRWICDNISYFFGAYLTSEYVRALETAALLDLPHANWIRNVFLRERHFGQLSGLNYEIREKKFAHELQNRKLDAFYWTPPDGESLAGVSLRVDYILDQLSSHTLRPSSAIIVSHFNVLQVFRTRIEGIMQMEFEKKLIKVDPSLFLRNGCVVHYTRRNPDTKEIAPYYMWRRIAVPWQGGELANPKWQELKYHQLSNQDLCNLVKSPL